MRVAESDRATGALESGESLQWSRNLRVAESRRPRPSRTTTPASMEPQLEGCGKDVQVLTALPAAPLQWSRNLRVAERPQGPAGPQGPQGFNGAAT